MYVDYIIFKQNYDTSIDQQLISPEYLINAEKQLE